MVNNIEIYDVSEVLSMLFEDEMQGVLAEENTVYSNSGKVVIDSGEYETNHYPLDKKGIEEQSAFDILSGASVDSLQFVVKAFISTVKAEVEKTENGVIYFSPAKTIDYVGTIAKPVYGWLIKQEDGTFTLEAESNFIVLPK